MPSGLLIQPSAGFVASPAWPITPPLAECYPEQYELRCGCEGQWFVITLVAKNVIGGQMQLADILGWTATTLFTICYIPQIVKTYKKKTVEGLSFRLLFISFVANIIALCYATLIKQPPLQVKYSLALCFLSVCIYLYLKVYFSPKRMIVNGEN